MDAAQPTNPEPQQQRMTTTTSLSWLPVYSGDLSALSSLSVCYVNLKAGCDSDREMKRRDYQRDWQRPAPPHCRLGARRFVTDDPIEIHADRLGLHRGAPPLDLGDGDA